MKKLYISPNTEVINAEVGNLLEESRWATDPKDTSGSGIIDGNPWELDPKGHPAKKHNLWDEDEGGSSLWND